MFNTKIHSIYKYNNNKSPKLENWRKTHIKLLCFNNYYQFSYLDKKN